MKIRIDLVSGTWHEGELDADQTAPADIDKFMHVLGLESYFCRLDRGRMIVVPMSQIASLTFTESKA